MGYGLLGGTDISREEGITSDPGLVQNLCRGHTRCFIFYVAGNPQEMMDGLCRIRYHRTGELGGGGGGGGQATQQATLH
jgi:hypothetical protein